MPGWIRVSVSASAVPRRNHVARRLLASWEGRVGVALTCTLLIVGLLAPVLAPYDPHDVSGPSLSPPSLGYLLGTDALGRDLLSGIVFGARASLIVAAGVGAIVFVIGMMIGTTAGLIGGRTDDLLMRITEFFQVIPRFFLAVLAIAFFGPGLDRIVIVLGITSWATLARTVRSETLVLAEAEFVHAARAAGATSLRIVLRNVLPNSAPTALVIVGLVVANALLLEASLGFLGLGDPNLLSWGFLASQAQQFLRVAWWLSLFPGIVIALAVLGLNLLGDALSHVLGGDS